MTQTVLVLGASGRFGRQAAQAFDQAGWTVRRFDRSRDDLNSAATGADVIVNAWNPPYPQWARQVPSLHAAVRQAALGSGATVMLPGNVYVFGAGTPAPWGPDSPHAATNPLGRIRIDMEAAYRSEGVRTIILRAGDFLDTEPSGNWFDSILIKTLAKGTFTYPGRTDIPHAWAFLPDLTRTALALAERRDSLPTFTDLAFQGYTLSGEEMRSALSEARQQDVRLQTMAWWPLRLAAPVWPMGRCLLEMRYLWDTPHSLDDRALRAILLDGPRTPVTEALRQATAHIPR